MRPQGSVTLTTWQLLSLKKVALISPTNGGRSEYSRRFAVLVTYLMSLGSLLAP
jgi:hypothetical protein